MSALHQLTKPDIRWAFVLVVCLVACLIGVTLYIGIAVGCNRCAAAKLRHHLLVKRNFSDYNDVSEYVDDYGYDWSLVDGSLDEDSGGDDSIAVICNTHGRASVNRMTKDGSSQVLVSRASFLIRGNSITSDVTSLIDNDAEQLSDFHVRDDRPTQFISEAGGRRLPQAIIIGVKKGGTRALLEFLRVHPDVRAAGPETHFFDKYYYKGFDWYRRQMPKTLDGQLTIEKTPSYFVTREAPSRLHRLSHVIGNDIRIILVVRDPVTRAISDYTQVMSKRVDTPEFADLAFVKNLSDMKVNVSWGAIRIGLYAKHLQRWLNYFPMRLIHVVNGERLISDPAGELAKLQDFLGLKRLVTDKHFYFNTTKGFPCLKKGEGTGKPRCLGNTKGRRHPFINDTVIQRLRQFYRPYNHKFYRITGIDFNWP